MILDHLRALPVEVEVRYGAPASATELAQLADALTGAVSDRDDILEFAGTHYDHERRLMELEYDPIEDGSTAVTAALLEDARAYAAAEFGGELPLPVVFVETSNGPVRAEAIVRGGLDLNRDGNNNIAECTAGFTAKRNGNRGVTTARHCRDRLRIGAAGAGDAISINPAVADYDAIDIQFHRTLTGNGHTTYKTFRATGRGGSDYRPVTAVSNAPMGSVVCHWGRTSGYSCDFVEDQDRCVTYASGRRWCGLDETQNNISAGGDSGGPWFLGQTARGIHSGGGPGASFFTRVGRMRFLDTTVLRR